MHTHAHTHTHSCTHTHTHTHVRMLTHLHTQIPNTGSHTIVRTHTKIQHTLIGMGSAALAAAVLYLGKATQRPSWDNELLPKKFMLAHHFIMFY